MGNCLILGRIRFWRWTAVVCYDVELRGRLLIYKKSTRLKASGLQNRLARRREGMIGLSCAATNRVVGGKRRELRSKDRMQNE